MARKRITISLDEDLLERIKLAAQKDDRKISNEVERILIKHYPPTENAPESALAK
ncbi:MULTISPECIES: toxin-antitoxin system protein [Floridanema]|uniref:Ribbon-helix-helix protein CopG domain-containing protein n=2 Tax=Floridanema TaxID=3396149 RepID=A0ABV4X4P1_9CYAN|nr:toxin-antitoxin system protein [Phormidium ambiguum]